MIKDDFLRAKLGFFIGFLNYRFELEQYLVKFQNEAPMTAFLYDSVSQTWVASDFRLGRQAQTKCRQIKTEIFK